RHAAGDFLRAGLFCGDPPTFYKTERQYLNANYRAPAWRLFLFRLSDFVFCFIIANTITPYCH
ncbi:hypothetical protein, partial [Cronobacter sakazakii]|uniref:hypothetical protein n=1 Tax=Cronobacter sakazakii TaxID=28141 RepID=UPI001C896B67